MELWLGTAGLVVDLGVVSEDRLLRALSVALTELRLLLTH